MRWFGTAGGRARTGVLVALVVMTSTAVLWPGPPEEGDPVAFRRDPWMRPFGSRSIWNVPIGSGARYAPADLPYTEQNPLTVVHLVELRAEDPRVPLLKSGGWRDRCSGTEATGHSLRLPDDFVLEPPRRRPDGSWSTPNNGFAFLQPDGRTIINGGQGARCEPGGPMYGHTSGITETDLYGDGIGGGHGASHLSSLGGAIRPGELDGGEGIRHALDLLVHAEHLYSDGKRTKESTYRWPATSSDSYALDPSDSRYRGRNPELRMGSLLALPPDLEPDDLDITTQVGLELFAALQDYGAYITDDSAWDANHLTIDAAAEGTFPWTRAHRRELGRMVAALHVVTNNGPGSVGGGGEPRRPLLPPLLPPGARELADLVVDLALRAR